MIYFLCVLGGVVLGLVVAGALVLHRIAEMVATVLANLDDAQRAELDRRVDAKREQKGA